VEINSMPFYIIRADENTLSYMEAHPAEFPVADLQMIAQRLRSCGIQSAPELSQMSAIPAEHLAQMADARGVNLVVHELVTLTRALPDPSQGGCISVQQLLKWLS